MTCRINDAVFDEHALLLGHAHKKRVKDLLVVLAQRPQLALGPVLELISLGYFWSSNSSDISFPVYIARIWRNLTGSASGYAT
jgi:hypothetical protein